jgi:Flp pilus assembly pilin Flp
MLVRLYVQAAVGLMEFRSGLRERLVHWTGSERGGVAAEYALLVALIAVFITAGAFLLGQAINTRLTDTATCVGGAPAPC